MSPNSFPWSSCNYRRYYRCRLCFSYARIAGMRIILAELLR